MPSLMQLQELPSHPVDLFINELNTKFSSQLFESVIQVVHPSQDKATASILKNNGSSLDDANVQEWLWILTSRGFSDTLLELFKIVGANQDYLGRLFYNKSDTLLGIAA